jgi:catechol 2,3-dioxygenase-like lactoylglutathione lyase family enzyme
VILPVPKIDDAAQFYEKALGMTEERVSDGRHYFRCGEVILACFSPRDDGDDFDLPPNPDHIYFAVDDLEAVFAQSQRAGCKRLDDASGSRPWGERSFYAEDPFGNKICFVDEKAVFTNVADSRPTLKGRAEDEARENRYPTHGWSGRARLAAQPSKR